MKKSLLIAFFASIAGMGSAFANGIALSNLSSISGSGFVQLQFDLTWSNSWFNATNYDAAWVFFKFKDNDGTWRHLNMTGANNVIAGGYTVEVPSDKTGAMIYRNATGLGTVSLTGVKVGITNLPGAFDIRGFALEMVEMPLSDSFFVGDGSGFPRYKDGAAKPFLVAANTITMGTSTGMLNATTATYPSMTNGILAAGFPIGYSTQAGANAFMMKHEISQAAYRDFLNTLTYTQQNTRTGTAPGSAPGTQAILGSSLGQRQGIQIATSGTSTTVPAVYGCNLNNNTTFNEADDGEWIGVGNLNWPDLAAFLDWAALRPMTDMEFEKAGRGPLTPVAGEYASGTANFAQYSYSVSNLGTANESIAYTGSVLKMNVTSAPTGNRALRVGIHATANATRISSGAGYYGALDLSGNISELMVTATNAAGRSFTGINGDGTLTTSGDANEDFWPGVNGNTASGNGNLVFGGSTGVTGWAGFTSMGGSATNANYDISTLYSGAGTSAPSRFQNQGGRGMKSW